MDFLTHKVPLFNGFPEDRLKELVDKSELTTFEPNEAIIEFGEAGRFLGILIQGEAESSISDDTGRRHRIAL
jgi:acetate kinase